MLRSASARVFVVASLTSVVSLAGCGSMASEKAEFRPLPGVTSEYAAARGTLQYESTSGRTEVRARFEKLPPDYTFLGHVHVGACSDPDPGGAHFRFDPEGGEAPPNEVHLNFTTNADGVAEVTTTAEKEIPKGSARSVVLHIGLPRVQSEGLALGGDGHTTHSHTPKALCADIPST